MTALNQFRKSKDGFYRDSPESPLLPEQQRDFSGLRYYAEDPSLRLTLEPEPFESPEIVELQTSTGDAARYIRWAAVRFRVGAGDAQLTIYRNPGDGALFLPFQDAGRGTETYGAGRYVEPELLEDGRLLIDFNYAYNPYCAYNDGWSCPMPPAENRLNVHIRAGEKAFHPEE